MDPVTSAAPDGAPRENLINTATNFLLSPKLARVSVTEQRAFLERKGLTPNEIDMAFQRRMAVTAVPAAPAVYHNVPRHSEGWVNFFNRLAMTVAVFSSASYALYWFFKTYVEPRLVRNRSEECMAAMLQELRDMREERRQKSESESNYVRETAKAIAGLRDEMSSLKKMLLARNQFPASPPVTGVSVKIPSWQKNHQSITSQTVEVKAPETQIEEETTQQERSVSNSRAFPNVTSFIHEVESEET